jgi:hypothetical protein
MIEEILEELKVEPVDGKLRRYKSNWLQVKRINSNGLFTIMLNYRPIGRRRLGRPLKRLLDEAEAGLLRPNLCRMMMMMMMMMMSVHELLYILNVSSHTQRLTPPLSATGTSISLSQNWSQQCFTGTRVP